MSTFPAMTVHTIEVIDMYIIVPSHLNNNKLLLHVGGDVQECDI